MADPASLRKIVHSPAPFSTWLGIVLLFVLFGVIVLAVIGPSPRGSDYEQMRAKKRIEKLKTLREESEKELTTYAWVDKSKGVARVPINRAMELEVAELAQKKPVPAGLIATPPPAQASSTAPMSSTAAGSPHAATAQPPPQANAAASPHAAAPPQPPASPAPASTP